jgi:hypothetical protein
MPLLESRRADEEGQQNLLGILHPGREVDQHLACHPALLSSRGLGRMGR